MWVCEFWFNCEVRQYNAASLLTLFHTSFGAHNLGKINIYESSTFENKYRQSAAT